MDKETGATPGPWKTSGYDSKLVVSELGELIAECWDGSDEQDKANARHIVRCVNSFDDLLEACKTLTFEIKCFLGDMPVGTILHSAIEKADAAISKAEATS